MKKQLKNILSGTTNLLKLDFLIRLSNQGLVLPFYHTVSDVDLHHIKHLYPVVTTKRFNEDLDFFQKNYTPVAWQYLLESVRDKSLRQNRNFFLSFDDGFREFHDVVAPILIQRGIPACCFINSAFVDNQDMFFRLKSSILIERIQKKELTKGEQHFIVNIFNQHHLKYTCAADLLNITDQNKAILDAIAPVVGVSFSEYLSVHQPYLTTSQIESLIKQGFSIGAHSVSHPYYPALSEDVQIEETKECLLFLKNKFHVTERLFSFPYTDFEIKRSFFNQINQFVDLTFGTANLKLDEFETNFQRIPMEIWGSKNAQSILKSEYLFYILKKLLGKHMIERYD